MYKKLLLVMCLLISYGTAVNAAEFSEGEHYVVVNGTPTSKPQITEYFSFYCPGCFKQEPLMNELKSSLPAGATFKKNHVDGMSGRNINIEHSLTKALVAADMLKVKAKVVAAIFNTIHVKKGDFSSDNDVRDLFIANGISGEKFDKAFKSFSVNTQAKKMRKNTAALRKQGHTSVPTLIINNKYKPVTKNIKSMAEYKALISYLLSKTS